MKKGTNNRYVKNKSKKVVRPVVWKKPKKKYDGKSITRAVISTGCCGMDPFDLGYDPW